MFRSISKTCFAAAYTLADAGRRFITVSNAATRMPFIVCYHRAVEDFDRSSRNTIPSMLVSTSMLERHVDWLAKRFSIVSVDEIAQHLQSGRAFPRPAAAVTFDDGYSDVYHHAYPLLQRKGIPWAVFVVTGLVGTGTPQIFDRLHLLLRAADSRGIPPARAVSVALESLGMRLPDLNSATPSQNDCFRVMTMLLTSLPARIIEELIAVLERRVPMYKEDLRECAPLTWDMIGTMHRNGVTIGSHTKSHTLLTTETLNVARRELAESKQALEVKLQTRINHFAYPDGRFNPLVVQAVKSAGYGFGYSICLHRDPHLPLLTIPRKVLWERSCMNALGRFSSSIMHCQAHWFFDTKDRCQHDHSTVRSGDVNAKLN
jgi:peptidoglycan/xylan/chitin deacetylase (PgdA/CDA1 family)